MARTRIIKTCYIPRDEYDQLMGNDDRYVKKIDVSAEGVTDFQYEDSTECAGSGKVRDTKPEPASTGWESLSANTDLAAALDNNKNV